GCLALWWYARFLQRITAETTTDLLRFALTPIAVDRLAQAFGLLLLHAAVIWSAALLLRAAVLISRTPRSIPSRLATVLAWAAGVGLGVFLTRGGTQPVPLWPFLLMVFASAGAAVLLGRPGGPVRRMSQAARVFGVYLALLFPALAVYPALHAFAAQAKESLVSGTFGPEAANIREDLQQQLQDAEDSIDARPGLELLLEPIAGAESPTSDQAFAVWSDTVLAARRLTSAVELYDRSGTLVSRFALNLPESATLPPNQGSCRASATPSWDVIEEVSNVLRASRAVCSGSSFAGSVVVRLMLDYRTLPFISSGRPYLESLDATPAASREDAPGRDVEFAVYGWSRSPIYMESTSVWRLPDDVFARMTMSRAPFWATVPRNAQQFRVYFLNDRKGIYALGYPLLTLTDHLINLAELVVLTGVLYVILLAGAGVVRSVTDPKHLSGRTLLREVRASFYRKLFLGFVAVALIPATVLALMTRARLVRQFTESVNDSAIKTATVAQRLVEDYAAIEQQRGANALERLDDQVMMLVERAIAQDVNLFDRATLQATSERELFASRVFPTRTPADVYRSIVLDRMLTFAAVEDAGGFSYLLAAAPVRASDSDQIRIVTVPLTLRQRDLDRQRDDLDRRVWSYFVLFVLLGSGLGYWMAERIADPVNRLSRATRRIARGDLEARIAAASSDELGRLVKDFNRMAADLQRQRHELERTQRLEAWADMARQVAHDIKNPLTPIQLSAEHALRVNQDKGRPLSPVLDDCVTAILGQVKLLRQISAEFSSFASSPTARPEPTDLAALVSGVVEPYRTGLATRIAIDAHADSDLPQALVDRTLFARALTNVIENALHAMPGGGRLSIAVSHAPNTPAALQVTVTDTGVGMDPEAVSRIFEPYFSTKASGTGLGLTIAKRNIELVGGSIAVESERGTGTKVAMTVPAAPVIS
ncbi:MAG TPA: HAMP domain-containing sensor histidine kinase, partial [Vicinamibacterales bacterium]|nr:HAMP domain-containing sensor histidine kinase [Vicinamibacterales bacterium]